MDISALTSRLSRLIIAENEKTRDLLNATFLQVSRVSPLDVPPQTSDDSWVSISRANTPSPSSTISIHEAVKSGTLQQVRKILRNPRQDVDELDEEGCSALHLACINDRFDIAKYLLRKGADVNHDNDTGSTPLHYAVQSGNPALVHFLLSRRANCDFENDDGKKPFHYAAKDNFLLDWMRRFGHNVDAVDPVTGCTALIQATKRDDVSSVLTLIEEGADLDLQCSLKNTALHYACKTNNLKIIKVLIDNECKLELRNTDGRTPLMIAARRGRK
jgi:ankyrin repeat protein